MSTQLQSMLKERADSLAAAAEIRARLTGGGKLHTAEQVALEQYEKRTAELTPKIEALQSVNTLNFGLRGPFGEANNKPRLFPTPALKPVSAGYFEDFHTYLASKGTKIGEHLMEGADGFGGFKLPGFQAASYEGGSNTGAPITPITVEQQVVELAPVETGVRKLASVIPTSMDIKIPRKTAFGSVALKAESGGSTNLFTDSDATLENFTLTAYMIGGSHTLSWELVQDVPTFQQFAVNDLLMAQAVYEDNLFLVGTGSGQPEGILGNVGTGVTGVTVGSDTYASELLQATFDVLGKLNAVYHPRAAWLMSRATGVVVQKAQSASNLFTPVWTRVGTQDYLHGYPVEYSSNMPAIGAGNTPVLFGSFVDGYVIGDRGGSGINVKILDQPLATAGQIILLAYRRVDGKVRRSEAIQPITLHT